MHDFLVLQNRQQKRVTLLGQMGCEGPRVANHLQHAQRCGKLVMVRAGIRTYGRIKTAKSMLVGHDFSLRLHADGGERQFMKVAAEQVNNTYQRKECDNERQS